MSSVNKVIILGRLTKDPEVKYMPNGDAVCNFSIATSESWKDKSGDKQEKSEFHNCVAFRKLGEVIGQYQKKGSQIYIEGKLQTRKWEKDGVTRYTTEIIVNEMTMLGGKRDDAQEEKQESKAVETQARPVRKDLTDDNFFDDQIPF